MHFGAGEKEKTSNLFQHVTVGDSKTRFTAFLLYVPVFTFPSNTADLLQKWSIIGQSLAKFIRGIIEITIRLKSPLESWGNVNWGTINGTPKIKTLEFSKMRFQIVIIARKTSENWKSNSMECRKKKMRQFFLVIFQKYVTQLEKAFPNMKSTKWSNSDTGEGIVGLILKELLQNIGRFERGQGRRYLTDHFLLKYFSMTLFQESNLQSENKKTVFVTPEQWNGSGYNILLAIISGKILLIFGRGLRKFKTTFA